MARSGTQRDINRQRAEESGETYAEPFGYSDQTPPPPGLYNRYTVGKADGTPIAPRAVYFVLRLDEFGDDKGHIEACRAAARTWCEQAPEHLRQVAEDLSGLLAALAATEVGQ